MQELTLVHYWMAGVMLVMAVYGGIALLGYRIQRSKIKDEQA